MHQGERRPLAINAKYLDRPLTGIERYAHAVVARLDIPFEYVRQRLPVRGAGPVWEQGLLPVVTRGRVLWTPGGVGPVAAPNHVLTVHDLIPLRHPEWYTKWFSAWYRSVLPLAVARARIVITGSAHVAGQLSEAYPRHATKVRWAPYGVDDRFRRPSEDAISEVIARHSLVAPYVVALGSVEPRKNLGTLLTAWDSHRHGLEGATLALIGQPGPGHVFAGDVPDSTVARAAVQWLGRVDDDELPALLAGACALAYVSLDEGGGLPPLEGMACGTPAIVSDIPTIREHCGDLATYVDPSDSEAIGSALVTAIARSPHDRAARAQLEAFGQACSWEPAASLVAAAALELGAQGSPRSSRS
jgi:glycosyltransferase involved in cell wall biosynthesis